MHKMRVRFPRPRKKVEKKGRKYLTKGERSGNLTKLSGTRVRGEWKDRGNEREHRKRNLKNHLTKRPGCVKIARLSSEHREKLEKS